MGTSAKLASGKWSEPANEVITDYDSEVRKRRDYRTQRFNPSDWKTTHYKTLYENALRNAGPYPTRGNYDFGRLFNYYWAELERDRFVEQLWPPFSVVFDLEVMMQRDSGTGSYYLRPNAASTGALMVREEFERSLLLHPFIGLRVLTTLFELGFESLPNTHELWKNSVGLAGAHHGSIVHRDLESENTWLRVDGLVKLMDFSLAKIGRSAEASLARLRKEFCSPDGLLAVSTRQWPPVQPVHLKTQAPF